MSGLLLRGSSLVVVLATLGCNGGERPSRSGERREVVRTQAPVSPAARDSLQEDAMEARLSRMATAPDADLAGMMPEYRAATSAILSDFGAEMTRNHLDSPEWRRMLAVLTSDLSRMEKMSPAELRAFWPEHSHRVHELLALHAWMNGRVQGR